MFAGISVNRRRDPSGRLVGSPVRSPDYTTDTRTVPVRHQPMSPGVGQWDQPIRSASPERTASPPRDYIAGATDSAHNRWGEYEQRLAHELLSLRQAEQAAAEGLQELEAMKRDAYARNDFAQCARLQRQIDAVVHGPASPDGGAAAELGGAPALMAGAQNRAANAELRAEILLLKAENERLAAENAWLRPENVRLSDEVDALRRGGGGGAPGGGDDRLARVEARLEALSAPHAGLSEGEDTDSSPEDCLRAAKGHLVQAARLIGPARWWLDDLRLKSAQKGCGDGARQELGEMCNAAYQFMDSSRAVWSHTMAHMMKRVLSAATPSGQQLLDMVLAAVPGAAESVMFPYTLSYLLYLHFVGFLPWCRVRQGVTSTAMIGKRRSLLIGINYIGSPSQLHGCINDVKVVQSYLDENGFSRDDQRVLVDDNSGHYLPTRKNILDSIKWLLDDAVPGDCFFLHFSGHGCEVPDVSGDEEDGFDSAIVPLDSRKGVILDDDLYELLVLRIPKGAKLTAVMDSCHSGTVMDLPHNFTAKDKLDVLLKRQASALRKKQKAKRVARTTHDVGEVVMFGSCKDEETAADVGGQAGDVFSHFGVQIPKDAGPGGAGGACTNALVSCLYGNKELSYASLLEAMRLVIFEKGFKQEPQLASSIPLDLDKSFSLDTLTTPQEQIDLPRSAEDMRGGRAAV